MKTFRLAFYVCALPLVATAIVSAQGLLEGNGESQVAQQLADTDAVEVVYGAKVQDAQIDQSHVVRIDDTGGVTGQILARAEDGLYGAVGVEVTANQKGQVKATSTASQDGTFRFEGIAPGAYTLIARSPATVTTFGIYVVSDGNDIPASGAIQMTVAAASANIGKVRELLNSDTESVAYSYTPDVSELVVQGAHRSRLTGDGTFNGRVVPLRWSEDEPRFNLQGNNVYLYNETGLVAQVPVDAEGRFSIPDVQPGVYDFVSYGPHGAAALSIQLTTADSTASTSSAGEFELANTAVQDEYVADEYGVVLCEPVGGGTSVDVTVAVPAAAAAPCGAGCGGGFAAGACCGGGYGGGGYGGGGYGGGFSGFGDIIGLAIGGWVLTELFDEIDDDDGVIRQPVVVPPVVIPPAVSPF